MGTWVVWQEGGWDWGQRACILVQLQYQWAVHPETGWALGLIFCKMGMRIMPLRNQKNRNQETWLFFFLSVFRLNCWCWCENAVTYCSWKKDILSTTFRTESPNVFQVTEACSQGHIVLERLEWMPPNLCVGWSPLVLSILHLWPKLRTYLWALGINI